MHEEPHFDKFGDLRKPDMVVELEDKAQVAKYDTEEMKEEVKRRYAKQQVLVTDLTLKMRGISGIPQGPKSHQRIGHLDNIVESTHWDFGVLALSSRQRGDVKTKSG